ncbi:MAG TPA: HAD domain-containing protein [Kofleriaceae bacterium]|nr:HAD domain-containing protein [Kofleriaceae bacterium]
MRVLFLDIDGVLNRVGFHASESLGLRSWIEPELARRLCEVLQTIEAGVVLISAWRRDRELEHLREELAAGGVECSLLGVTPVLGTERWREIEAWMREHDVDLQSVVILDDGYDMGPLENRFVRTSPLNGLDEDAARRVLRLFDAKHDGAQ